jgi:hypothetical protein
MARLPEVVMNKLAASILVFFLAGCATENTNKPQQPPEWLLRHREDKNLKGVVVNISPEVPGAERYFSTAKPHEVLYLFEDGRVHAVNTSFEGEVTDEWFASSEMDIDTADVVPLEVWASKFSQNKR